MDRARRRRRTWRRTAAASDYPALALAWREAEQQLAALAALAPQPGSARTEKASAALAADAETPWRLPRLHELARRFGALGLAQLLDEAGRCRSGDDPLDPPTGGSIPPDPPLSPPTCSWPRSTTRGTARSWTRSGSRDLDYAAEYGVALDEIAGEFRARDVEHLAANRARVRRAWAEQLRDTVDRHPLQARVIRKQAALRRGHLPLRGCSTRPATCCSRSSRAGRCRR